MRIRRAGLSDVPVMSALGRRAFTDAYGASSHEADLEAHLVMYFSEASISREMARAGIQYFVADDDGTLAGLVKLRDSDLPDAVPTATAIEVQQLYVDTALQRGGIGQRLMQRAVDATREAGAGGIWLSVWSEADWATSFYRRCGFVSLGELDFYLGRTHYVDYLMWLPVSAELA